MNWVHAARDPIVGSRSRIHVYVFAPSKLKRFAMSCTPSLTAHTLLILQRL
ncbi:hypothetical protein [Paraburkholderia sp. BL21I4N1]|uniref:hypothetical protein n=1 Tax=Paraburkholderia sp. BL21I4N1 TaxID=1938801 RepID=UPI0015E39B88|nr:hypothetical protein [Paraburkholderia sp. BL21I4N1]